MLLRKAKAVGKLQSKWDGPFLVVETPGLTGFKHWKEKRCRILGTKICYISIGFERAEEMS